MRSVCLQLVCLVGWVELVPCLSAAEARLSPLVLHVATNGQDHWSGRVSVPTPDGADGPLASVLAARDAIRRARSASPEPIGPVTVLVRGGAYRMAAPFVLEPQDSGSEQAPVVFAAFQDEHPVLSGGRVISGFRQNGHLWECDLPDVKAGRWYFRQLFVNGARRTVARSPNEGYYRIAKLMPGPRDARSKPIARDRFGFQAGDLQPYARLADVDLVLMHSWETSIHPLKSVDPTAQVVEFAAPLKEWWSIGYWEEAQRYYVENALELLDQPGEWYLNRETGRLSYRPLPGEPLGQVEVVAPALTDLARLAGDPDGGRPVSHIELRGLTFHHADWVRSPQGNSSTQAAVDAPAAVTADGADHCVLEGCEVAHVGAYGVWFRRGCKECRLQRNRVWDLGAGGIRIGEANRAKTDAAESTANLVDNNHIFDTGHVLAAGIGLWLAQSSSNRISHNEIHDTRYSGMSIGWNWGDETNRTHHNLIEFNHVHHVSNGYLSDSGLIYCLGASPGSIIRNNVFHDNWPYSNPPFGWGIYLDATCNGYLVESNVVYNTLSGGLMFNNGGHEHVIRNNIFAFSANVALWPYWEKRPNTFTRNLVYLTQGALLVSHGESSLRDRQNARQSLGLWDENLYWHTGGPEQLRFFQHTFEEWQALGLDPHSRMADPQFVNPNAYDFRVRPGSPAWQLGFAQIDTSQVGLYGEPAWVDETRRIGHPPTVLPPPPAPPKPREISDDFEATSVGAHPKDALVSGEEMGASICVSDEQACGGRHSLKITDAKDLKPSWQPHFYYEPRQVSGRVRQSFDVWLGANAQFFAEWRDHSNYPHNVGPSLRFDEHGAITADGRVLATVPLRQWVHVEIEAALGKAAPRTFKVTLTPPTGPAQTFSDLPISGREFKELQWLGFSSTAAADTMFYLDNLKIQRVRE